MADAGKKVDLLDEIDGDATFDVVMGGVTVTLPSEMPATVVGALTASARAVDGDATDADRVKAADAVSAAIEGLVPEKLRKKHSAQRLLGAVLKAYGADMGEPKASSD